MKEVEVLIDSTYTRIPKLLDYELIVEPLWADDTGRKSREGQFSGTFIGYFTNLNLTIGPTTQAEYTILCNMFQKSIAPICSVKYPREDSGNIATESFYGVALKAKKNDYTGKYDGFTIQLTAINKR